MGYVERHLLPDERVQYMTRLHWIMLLRPWLLVLVGLGICAASWWIPDPSGSWVAAGSVLRYLGSAVTVAGLLWVVLLYIEMRTSEFAVTNFRLILKVGLIARYTTELLISKVESIGVGQSLGGRLFDYGDLTVTGTGGVREIFRRVKNPIGFRNHVQLASIHPPERQDRGAPSPPA